MPALVSNPKRQKRRKKFDRLFRSLCFLLASLVVVILAVLLTSIFSKASTAITLNDAPPTISEESDNGISRYDGVTNDNSPTVLIIKNYGPEDSTAKILARSETDGKPFEIGRGKAEKDGSFAVECDQMEDGNYSIWFEVLDKKDNKIRESETIPLVIDTVSPDRLTIDESILGDRELVKEELENFVIGGDGVEVASQVIVHVFDELGNSVGPIKARIKEGGKWRIPPTRMRNLLNQNSDGAKSTGKIRIEIEEIDLAGNSSPLRKLELTADLDSSSQPNIQTEFSDEQTDLSVLEVAPNKRTHLYTFATSYHHNDAPQVSGIWAAIIGSALLCLVCACFTIPIGVGTAIFLEDFKPKNKTLRIIHGFVQLNINNLAGVPSIVYGILGVTAFVYMFSIFPAAKANTPPKYEFGTNYYYQVVTLGGRVYKLPCKDKYQTTIEINEPVKATRKNKTITLNVVESAEGLSGSEKDTTVVKGSTADLVDSEHYWYYTALPFGKGFLSAGLTLGMVVLPIIIIASQEAIRAVPDSLREASLGMGATRWQTVRHLVLPSATPGIMTGTILALSRAIGEAAPILAVMGGIISNTGGPSNMMDSCTALPVLIYKWARDSEKGFWSLSAAAIVVLLILLLLMNSIAIIIRYRAEKKHG